MEGCNALEKARRFYIWSWQGRGRAGVKEPGGWRFMSRDTRGRTPVDDWNNNSHLWNIANRLLQVQIEHDDALKVIQRFDDPKTLFYIDPPYVQHTRGLRWNHSAYSFEYTDDNHRELAQLLKSITGMIVISGYPSELYNSLYQDWHKIERPGQKDNAPQRDTTECLWLSPNIHTIQKEMKLRQTTILTPGQFSRLWGIPE
jgi:DNA adenine methylase